MADFLELNGARYSLPRNTMVPNLRHCSAVIMAVQSFAFALATGIAVSRVLSLQAVSSPWQLRAFAPIGLAVGSGLLLPVLVNLVWWWAWAKKRCVKKAEPPDGVRVFISGPISIHATGVVTWHSGMLRAETEHFSFQIPAQAIESFKQIPAYKAWGRSVQITLREGMADPILGLSISEGMNPTESITLQYSGLIAGLAAEQIAFEDGILPPIWAPYFRWSLRSHSYVWALGLPVMAMIGFGILAILGLFFPAQDSIPLLLIPGVLASGVGYLFCWCAHQRERARSRRFEALGFPAVRHWEGNSA